MAPGLADNRESAAPLQKRRRKELNRVYARRHYYKTLDSIQGLRKQEQELEEQYEFYRARFGQDNAALKRLELLEKTRHALVDENRALRDRKEEVMKWEHVLRLQMESQRMAAVEEKTAALSIDSDAQTPPLSLALKRPMTVAQCHERAQAVYIEIQAFLKSKHFVSTGSAAFGWMDRRQIEDNKLMFSLQKVFDHVPAVDLMAVTWPMVSTPEAYRHLYSKSMNMRCELVQQVDHNNVVLYQEYQVRERGHSGARDSVAIMRSLLLNTLFETETGYVVLSSSLDPTLLVNWPEVTGPVPLGMPVKYDPLPSFTWCSFEHAGDSMDRCKVSHVGSQQTSDRPYWAVEVLMFMLRWERSVIGPQMLLSDASSCAEGV